MNKAIECVWNAISFPEAARLGKRIPKKQFLESGELVASDRKLFRENVRNFYWEYTLKPSTCPVIAFRDNEREYLEVAILEVEMDSQRAYKRIAEVVHRVIPYPLMLGFYTETGEIALSIAPKRFSQAEHGAFVTEHFFTTAWMNSEAFNERESAFIKSLAWKNMLLHDYATLYNAWIDRFTAYECSMLSGVFTIGKAVDRLESLAQCREIQSIILELRGQLKKAAFNRQVELNTQIKKFEQQLNYLATSL